MRLIFMRPDRYIVRMWSKNKVCFHKFIRSYHLVLSSWKVWSGSELFYNQPGKIKPFRGLKEQHFHGMLTVTIAKWGQGILADNLGHVWGGGLDSLGEAHVMTCVRMPVWGLNSKPWWQLFALLRLLSVQWPEKRREKIKWPVWLGKKPAVE